MFLSISYNIAADPATLFKKDTLIQVFPVNFAKLLRLPFFIKRTLQQIYGYVNKILTTQRNQANKSLLKINNRNTRKRCEICSKLTTETPEKRHRRHFGVFIVNFEHVFHLF